MGRTAAIVHVRCCFCLPSPPPCSLSQYLSMCCCVALLMRMVGVFSIAFHSIGVAVRVVGGRLYTLQRAHHLGYVDDVLDEHGAVANDDAHVAWANLSMMCWLLHQSMKRWGRPR